jgi:hypothetical protein
MRGQGDKETRRQGDKETRRQGDKEAYTLLFLHVLFADFAASRSHSFVVRASARIPAEIRAIREDASAE